MWEQFSENLSDIHALAVTLFDTRSTKMENVCGHKRFSRFLAIIDHAIVTVLVKSKKFIVRV
jgi:hypothetical protein